MQQNNYSNRGLPRYFIAIGISLIILPILLTIMANAYYHDIRTEIGNHNVEIIKAVFGNCIILGLAFIAFTRSKVENETTWRARLGGILGAFVAGVVMVILSPVFDLFGSGEIESIDSRQLISFMLIMSMVFRYSAKKSIEKQSHYPSQNNHS